MIGETAIVDADYYKARYHGNDIPDALWVKYESQAEDEVNYLCNGWFDYHTLDEFPANFFEHRIKMAICAQAEYFNELEGATELSDGLNSVSNASIGNFSYSQNSRTPQKAPNRLKVRKLSNILSQRACFIRGCANED